MAWARDKNGKEVWLDESGVLPPMAREELDRPMPLPDWVQERNRRNPPVVKVSEGFELMDAPAGVRDGGGAEARSLHGGPTDIAGRGAQVAGPLRSAAASPFAESFFSPDVVRPAVSLSPVVVEASRMPPVVEGVTMRRGAPGSGDYGERADLTPTAFRRDAPMGVEEAKRKGLIYAVPLQDNGPMDLTAASRINATPGMRAFDMEMRSEDAAAMRQGFRAESAARRAAAAMRATGHAGDSRDIVAKILGEEQAEAASVRRMREARVTPQVRDGVAYDPLTGKSAEVQRGKPSAQPLDTKDDDEILAGLSKYGKPKPMTAKELAHADPAAWAAFQSEKDPEKKRAYLQPQWTDDNQRVYEQYRKQAEARGLIPATGGGAGGRKTWRDVMGK